MKAKTNIDTPLNVKQKKFVKNLLQTGKTGESALRAGFSDGSYGSLLKTQPNIQAAILTEMEKQGLSDGFLAEKLKDGLEASYPSRLSVKGAVLQPESPDHLNRRGYLDMCLRIKGSYAPDKIESTQRTIVINMDLHAVQGLADSGAITEEEEEALKSLPEHEDSDCISLPKSAIRTGG